MSLLSFEELAEALSVPEELLRELVARKVLIPYGGRARLGEPRFSIQALPHIRDTVQNYLRESGRVASP